METMDTTAAEALRAYVQRIERLEEEKANIAADIKDVYSEAKSMGYDAAILRKVVAMRRKEPHELEEEGQLLDLYMSAVGLPQ